MISRQQALTRLRGYKESSGSNYGFVSLGLFGSLARNQATNSSDVDVVIETRTADAFQIVHLKEDLEKLLQTHADVVRKRPRMNPFLKKRIDRDSVYV